MTQRAGDIEKRFTYDICINDRGIAPTVSDFVSSFEMKIKFIGEDEECNLVSEESVGEISGVLITRDFCESADIYYALDAESSDLEEIGQYLQSIEEDEESEIGNCGAGYLIIEHITFDPKYERTGVEQCSVKTLMSKFGLTTHGTIVYPIKETKGDEQGFDYDRSPAATAYMQKIFTDVGFKPIKGTPFFGFWAIYHSKKWEEMPTLAKFKLSSKRFKVDESKIYENKPDSVDAKGVMMLHDFAGDMVYQLAEQLGVSPESVVRNYMSDNLRAGSKLVQYAEATGISPVEIIRKDRVIRGGQI